MKVETMADMNFRLIWCRLTQVYLEEGPLNKFVVIQHWREQMKPERERVGGAFKEVGALEQEKVLK